EPAPVVGDHPAAHVQQDRDLLVPRPAAEGVTMDQYHRRPGPVVFVVELDRARVLGTHVHVRHECALLQPSLIMNLPSGDGASAPHPQRGSPRPGERKPPGPGQRSPFSRSIASPASRSSADMTSATGRTSFIRPTIWPTGIGTRSGWPECMSRWCASLTSRF